MIKRTAIYLLAFALCLSLCGCSPRGADGTQSTPSGTSTPVVIDSADISGMDFEFSARDVDSEYETVTATVRLNGTVASVDGSGAELAESGVVITSAGTYLIAGEFTDCYVTVSAGAEDKVQLVFGGVSITNSNGPAVYVKSADKVFITLEEGSVNTLSDGAEYTFSDRDTSVDAAVFSRADLTVNGSGTLNVKGNAKHGIVSKDDLVVTGCTLNVESANVGLCGKDCVKLGEANITVTAGSDGIRSDNAEDADRGFVLVNGAKLSVSAANDGIQAETVIKIDDGEIGIAAGVGSQSVSYNSESMKGLKATSDILISGGNIEIVSIDDCIHSNNSITISGGRMTLASADDGIHADTDLSVSGGEIIISQSYEGIEGTRIIISGGNIDLTASDDGLNAAGGNDSSGMGGRPGQGNFSASTGSIYISGGYTLINAYGDGVDSNGNLEVSGGVTLVSGPTNNGNGAFDYDASATVTGGVLVALGTNGMAQGFTDAQNQGAILCSFTSQQANTNIALVNSQGEVVASFTPAKAYQSAVITAPGINTGESYKLVAGGEISNADANGFAQNGSLNGGNTLLTIEMASNIYGNSGGMGGMGPGGGMAPGGMRPSGGPRPR